MDYINQAEVNGVIYGIEPADTGAYFKTPETADPSIISAPEGEVDTGITLTTKVSGALTSRNAVAINYHGILELTNAAVQAHTSTPLQIDFLTLDYRIYDNIEGKVLKVECSNGTQVIDEQANYILLSSTAGQYFYKTLYLSFNEMQGKSYPNGLKVSIQFIGTALNNGLAWQGNFFLNEQYIP